MSKILVVEDNPSHLELMGDYLREKGYTVINASNAKEALYKAATKKPDVVITDVVMPGMNGFELCRNLKSNPTTERLPVIICTSKDKRVDRLWGIKQGADIYITKPFTQEQLVRAVQSVI